MSEETNKTSENGVEDREEQQARRRHWRRVRRRFVGAGAVFLLIGLLWQLGDDARAPNISPAPLPEAELSPLEPGAEIQAAEESLAETEEALDGEVETEKTEIFSDTEYGTETAEELTENAEPAESAEENAGENAATPAAEPAPVFGGADQNGEAENISPSPFAVQIGSFVEEGRARRAAKKLNDNDFTVIVEEIVREGTLMRRVRAVGYQSRAEAELARQKLTVLGYGNAQIRDTR